MRVLLDTQCFILAATESWQTLPGKVQRLLHQPDTVRVVSSISVTEAAIATAVGKLRMSLERVDIAVLRLQIDLLPYTPSHARRLFDLPLHHREPFDRMLIATALAEDIPLVGGDARFPAYKPHGLSVIWK